jgi:Ala-tRNA(Pro) deacylase
MAVSERLKAYLQASRVSYTTARHPVVYTAQEIAAAQHVSGRHLAKCVLVKTDQGPVLAVLPAVHLIDFKRLKAVLGVKSLSLGKEADVKQQFPDVEVGAMSPFGNLYQVRVFVDKGLGESDEIVFNAGTHTDTITMRYKDFLALVKPKLGAFAQALEKPKKAAKKPAGKKNKASSHVRKAKKRTSKKPRKRKSRRSR